MFSLDRLKELSKEKGISISFICKKLGMAKTYFHDLKKTGRDIPEENLKSIADLLDTTPEYLLGKTEQKEKPAEDGGLGENVVRFLGRDGKVLEKKLTPELLAYLESIPDSDDKL